MSSGLRNTRPRPVLTLVAVTNSLIEDFLKLVGVDRGRQDIAKRIEPRRVEIVGREQPRRHVEGEEGGRHIHGPSPHQHVERRTLERAQKSAIRDAAPEVLKRLSRFPGAAFRITGGQHGGVHCAGRSAGNAVDFEPGLFKKPVQDAPRESAVRAAALKRKINQNWIAI